VITVALAGATGWTGSAVAQAVLEADDLTLRAAVARRAAGTDLGDALGLGPVGVPVYGGVADALDGVDVLVDYTSATAVRDNVLTALDRGVGVVVGSSGLTGGDYDAIDAAARAKGVGVIAAGNFSITAAMMAAAAVLVAPYLPRREIVDYAYDGKRDAPSGTARELAERLAGTGATQTTVPIGDTVGAPQTRGATIAGTQVHSVRLPSFTVSTEIVFALPGERLSIRQDAGESAEPYVAGTLAAVRALPGRVGLTRGLDTLLLGRDVRPGV
jgi:4-hydroxy-tetrahydrodipicolinate reductase